MIRPHVLDVVMSVIFSIIFPGNVKGTKQRYVIVRRADREILALMVKMFMLQCKWCLLKTLSLWIKNAIHSSSTQVHQVI